VAWSLLGAPADDAREILGPDGLRGGLIVHVGCGDGSLTALLRGDGNAVVQGLDRDAAAVGKARGLIRSRDLYGPVSAEVWTEPFLPYADNLVNLLVVEKPALVSEAERLRVLAPGGTVCVRQGTEWARTTKPAPAGVDEWTHYLHDASGNPVAHDSVVAPPRNLQWSAPPMHTRAHEYTPGIWALVSTGGRVFFVQDKAPVNSMAALPQWHLIARDAHNGLLLWERPLKSWFSHLVGWTTSPIQLQRRMVAVGDRVYVPLTYHGPVSVLDAKSGDLLKTFAETQGADEVLVQNGVLLIAIRGVTDERLAEEKKLADMARRRGSPMEERDSRSPFEKEFRQAENRAPRSILALDAATGNVLWQKAKEEAAGLRPLSLRACGGKVFYHTNQGLLCVDLRTGKEIWQRKTMPLRTATEAGGVCWSKTKVELLSIEDGHTLWTQEPVLEQIRDVFILDDSVWIGGFKPFSTGKKKYTGPVWGPYFAVQRDLKTGEVIKEIAEENPGHHHRCYSSKATNRYILGGRRGTEFLDLDTGDVFWHSWARGVCRYGVMPANGMLYVPPHACACYLTARVTSFNAMVGERPTPADASPRLVKGPAYGSTPGAAQAGDWPTYRGDAARSGRATASVPTTLQPKWTAEIGADLSAPTVAEGKVLVASPNEHRLVALDRASGKPAWEFVAGGRVDSPPTIHRGQVLFGSHDGQVYSLRTTDGELAWRFRAAKDPQQIACYGQVESASPVPGSVLVQDDTLCLTAGRSSFLDGGITLFRLNPRTAEVLSETAIYSPDPETGQQPKQYNANQMPGARSDILVGDGSHTYLRDLVYTKDGTETKETQPHLFTLTDFLDASWPHRSYWIYGTQSSIASGCSGQSRTLTYGRMLLFDETNVYGYGRGKVHWSNQFQDGPYRLFGRKKGEPKVAWEAHPEICIRAMVLAGDVIFAAGPILDDPGEPTVVKGAALMAFSTADGKQLARLDLPAPPVFDGLAAAGGELFLALEGGRVMCFSGR
jgi:outer membrane protein assembly factor BamB